MTDPKRQRHEEFDLPRSRDELAEKRYWPAVTEHFFQLRTGDKITVESWRATIEDIDLTITRRKHGDFYGETDNGEEFRIAPSHWGGKHGNVGGGRPWIHRGRDQESFGEIKSITVNTINPDAQ